MSDERIAALLAGAAVPDATAAREATVVSALRALRGEGPGRRTGSGNDPKLGRTSTERPEGEAPARAGAAGSDPGREPAAPRHRWLPRLARRGWAIAALAVFRTFEGFVISFFSGFTNAASILVGKEVGAGNHELAFKRAKRLIVLTPIVVLLMILYYIVMKE